MKVVVSHYKVEPVELIPGLIGYKVSKVSEESINVKDEAELENILPRNSSEALIISSDKLGAVNVSSSIRYTLPEPMKLLRLGYPKDMQNIETVSMEYLTFFDKDLRLIGLDITDNFDKPFVILEFEKGYIRIISKGEIESKPKESKVKKAKKKSRSKRKKSAKRSSSRQKATSKSVRKS